MGTIINFPSFRQLEPEQPESLQNEFDEINLVDEIDVPEVDDIDFETIYTENEKYQCVKCGCDFTEENQAWRISQKPDKSILYNCEDKIAVCDNCISAWLNL